MPFQIIRNDITKVRADAIVNTANPEVTIGAGLDSAIYEAAGKSKLLAARAKIGQLPAGSIGVTPAFHLPAKYIIHASGPRWKGGSDGESIALKACYDKSLREASRLGCGSIAFPLLSTGTYEFPREEALRIAVDSFSRFLENHDMEIYLVVFDSKSTSVSEKMFLGLREYVDENYVTGVLEEEYDGTLPSAIRPNPYRGEDADYSSVEIPDFLFSHQSAAPQTPQPKHQSVERQVPPPASVPKSFSSPAFEPIIPPQKAKSSFLSAFTGREPKHDLNFYVETADDPFCQYLQQLINKKGYKNSQVYKKANLTKQYFSKLMNGQVNPTKEKLLSISIALELNMDETKDMLMMAGYAMSPCNKVDLVVAYFIRRRIYNMFDIEIALDDLGLPTLSSY